jgi:4-diphosphocytidyl-2-C-methyl-D-erythritol kinase
MPTAVRSHAKINLGLYIGAPRADGFHALATVYQTLELHDTVTVAARLAPKTAIRLTSNDRRVPTDGRNTAWKMISLVLDELRVTAEVEIHIEKRLPVQGGLGAGSGNAVAALVGLEAELGIASQRVSGSAGQPGASGPGSPQTGLRPWGGDLAFETRESTNPHIGVPNEALDWPARRLQIAAQVGSDVPLFLIGGTVLGFDRGQEVSPLTDLEPIWCVVALPETGVSTPQAFRDWDALCAAEGLTPEASEDKLKLLSRAYASAFAEAIPQGGLKTGSSGVLSKNQFPREDLAGPLESALVRTGITSWIENDFERVVFAQHPSLREIKRILAGSDTPEAAVYASLSGSGSALFGLYLICRDAEAACARLQAAGVQSQLTRTLPRTAYWREMLS